MKNYHNVVYILTNPLYAGYVKIGYASDLSARLSSLNTGMLRNFEAYAVYETPVPNADKQYHAIIDDLAPIVRARVINGQKVQDKEFYKLEPEQAYDILKHIAVLTDTQSRLHRMDEPETLPPTTPYLQAETAPKASIKDDLECSSTAGGKPLSYIIAGREYPFISWGESLVRHCNVIAEIVGFATFKAAVNGMKINPKAKRVMFSDNEGDFEFQHHQIAGEQFWVDTNQSAKGIQTRNKMLNELFPNAALEYVYD